MKVPNGGGEGEAGEDAMKTLLWYSANVYSQVRKKMKFVVLCWKLLEARNMDILFASESNFFSLLSSLEKVNTFVLIEDYFWSQQNPGVVTGKCIGQQWAHCHRNIFMLFYFI